MEGSCSNPIFAVTGYPEGDPMSVVAMMLINLAMHHMVEYTAKQACISSFVDNWEAQSSAVDVTHRAYASMETFADLIDIKLDQHKTLFWAVTADDRAHLKNQGCKVSHHAADLGGHINYTRKITNYTVRARIAKN